MRASTNIPTWLGSAILVAVAVFALGSIYVVTHEMRSPAVVLSTPLASSSAHTLMAAPAVATSSTPSATTTQKTVVAGVPVTKLPKVSTVSTTTLAARALAGSGAELLKSMVNIVCLSGNPSIPSISGSGVIIDSRGIILTAAHVAQLFLLQDYLGTDIVSCLIRTGSPARRAYTAEPIYVSPSWIRANPNTLKTSSPTGTGENDFALLAITGTATSTPLPASYPAVPLTQTDPQLNEQVAIGSYGAEYLTSSELNYSLYPILVFGSIDDRYTFDTDTVDLVSVDGTAASQEGSSGGGLIDADGNLIGIITTSSVSGSIADRALNAVTIGHMRRSFEADTGKNLDSSLANTSIFTLVANFKNQALQLAQALNY
jgi:S1-C subfamily serine protease